MNDESKPFLESLKLQNLNCFAQIDLTFHNKLTVLVAPNGGGKTTVLDGAAVALRLFVDTMEGLAGSKGFHVSGVRRILSPDGKMEPVMPVRLEASGYPLGTRVEWARELRSEHASRTTTVEAQDLRGLATRLSRENLDWVERRIPDPPLFPLIAYYGTGRLWKMGSLTKGRKTRELSPNARYRGYTDCLAPSSHYKMFEDWFQRFSYEARNENSPHEPERVLSAVRNAVNIGLALTGWRQLEWDFAEKTIVAHHNLFGRLPVDFLSDGIRTMLGLVADVAHRATRLNPHFGEDAAAKTPGIVLIDEVDMHLHPEWQQVVLQTIQSAFPRVQFIVTTHSPQVLTTVRKENVRILCCDEEGNGVASEPAYSPLAHESGDALALIMETHPRPEIPVVLPDIHLYEQLARAGRGDTEEARQIKSRLDAAGFEFNDAELAFFKFLAGRADGKGK